MLSENIKDIQDVKYISIMGSIAHTYGNLLATVQKWVLDLFEPNFFKTIHVGSQIAHKQLLSTPHQFLKKTKPIAIFRPRISYNEDTFLKGTLMTERMGGELTTKTPGIIDLHPFFFDQRANIDIQYSETRRVMNLDVMFIFSTEIQQINYMEYLKNQIRVEGPFDIPTHLEAYLPKEMMELVSNLSGVPLYDASGSIHDFLEYMNTYSFFPVTYKLAGASGKEEFYRYYPTKIYTTISDLDPDTGETVGQVSTNYKISFTMRLEFWTPGLTYIFSNKIHQIPKPITPKDSTLIPIYADIFLYEDLDLNPGWRVHSHASYILEKKNDMVSFDTMLEQSIKEVLKYHIKTGIPIVNFMDVKVRKQGSILQPQIDYVVNYETMEIQFHNRDYGYFTYTIIISIDALYVNQLVAELFHLD